MVITFLLEIVLLFIHQKKKKEIVLLWHLFLAKTQAQMIYGTMYL
jgi:hypothetical protein